jgi:hypothetical protein
MARVLDRLPTRVSSTARNYPWDQWFDGQVWELEHGVDFVIGPKSFQNIVYEAARRRGLVVATRTTTVSLVIQAQGRR